jgi:hypothetical protein
MREAEKNLIETINNLVKAVTQINSNVEKLAERTLGNEKVIGESFQTIANKFQAIENSIGDLYLVGKKEE